MTSDNMITTAECIVQRSLTHYISRRLLLAALMTCDVSEGGAGAVRDSCRELCMERRGEYGGWLGEEGKLLLNEIRTGGMWADGSSVVVMEGSGSGSGQWNGGEGD